MRCLYFLVRASCYHVRCFRHTPCSKLKSAGRFCVGGCCFGTRSNHSTNRNAFRRQQPRDLHDAKPRNACWARLRSDLVTKAARPITFGMVLEGYLFPSFLKIKKDILVAPATGTKKAVRYRSPCRAGSYSCRDTESTMSQKGRIVFAGGKVR